MEQDQKTVTVLNDLYQMLINMSSSAVHQFSPIFLNLYLGVSEYLSTEICTSRQKRFSLVTFVDSPGLVDGDMKYPFDVDEVIMWLGE